MSNLLTTQDVAEFLGLDPMTLWRWRRDGHGPPFLALSSGIKPVIRYSLNDIEKWLSERRYIDEPFMVEIEDT